MKYIVQLHLTAVSSQEDNKMLVPVGVQQDTLVFTVEAEDLCSLNQQIEKKLQDIKSQLNS